MNSDRVKIGGECSNACSQRRGSKSRSRTTTKPRPKGASTMTSSPTCEARRSRSADASDSKPARQCAMSAIAVGCRSIKGRPARADESGHVRSCPGRQTFSGSVADRFFSSAGTGRPWPKPCRLDSAGERVSAEPGAAPSDAGGATLGWSGFSAYARSRSTRGSSRGGRGTRVSVAWSARGARGGRDACSPRGARGGRSGAAARDERGGRSA